MIERKPQDGSIHTEPGTASKRHLTERTPYKGPSPRRPRTPLPHQPRGGEGGEVKDEEKTEQSAMR